MKKIFRFFLSVTLIVIFVLAAMGFFIIRGQPKVTVDYLAEYNRISCPANYDPCQNAAQLYEEAFNSFVEMPKQLQRVDYAKWVEDFNKTEQDLLQKWLIENGNCFQKFRKASQKPYNWVKRECSKDNELISMKFPGIRIDLLNMIAAITWNAKFNAAQGKYVEAFDDLLAIYLAGYQQCTPSIFLIEFEDNLQRQQIAMETASLIADKTPVPNAVLKSFQQQLEEISNAHTCFFDFMADKLTLYDILQRTYVYKPNGTGRLSWKRKSDFYTMCGDNNNWLVIKSCFIGPTQNKVKKEIDSYYEKVNTVFTITPWELHKTQPDYFDKLGPECRGNIPILYVYGLDYRRAYYNYYDTQAQLQALLTTIAVMRFRQDNGHLPNELDELIKARYLQKLPADPYNEKSLIYKVEGENFRMYSIGNNFEDDGGKGSFLPRMLGSSISSADLVFWPPTEPRKAYLTRILQVQESNPPSQKPK